MSSKLLVPSLGLLLVASLAFNAWLLRPRGGDAAGRGALAATAPPPAPSAAPTSTSTNETAASLAALVKSVETGRRGAAPPATPTSVDKALRAPVNGFGEGRVSRALLDDVQCRVAQEKAAAAWRKEAESIREALLREPAVLDAPMRAAQLTGKRSDLADIVGVDEADTKVEQVANQLLAFEDEAGAEVRRLMEFDPPDWRAALDVVRGLYRQQDAAVLQGFGAQAADDWRMNDVDERAAILAIGASLVGVPWSSIDDGTPPAWQ